MVKSDQPDSPDPDNQVQVGQISGKHADTPAPPEAGAPTPGDEAERGIKTT